MVGKILEKRYVVLEAVGPDGEATRYLVYDMNSLRRLHLRVLPAGGGEDEPRILGEVDAEQPLASPAPPPVAGPSPLGKKPDPEPKRTLRAVRSSGDQAITKGTATQNPSSSAQDRPQSPPATAAPTARAASAGLARFRTRPGTGVEPLAPSGDAGPQPSAAAKPPTPGPTAPDAGGAGPPPAATAKAAQLTEMKRKLVLLKPSSPAAPLTSAPAKELPPVRDDAGQDAAAGSASPKPADGSRAPAPLPEPAGSKPAPAFGAQPSPTPPVLPAPSAIPDATAVPEPDGRTAAPPQPTRPEMSGIGSAVEDEPPLRQRIHTREIEAAWFAQGDELPEEEPSISGVWPADPGSRQAELRQQAAQLSPEAYRRYALELPDSSASLPALRLPAAVAETRDTARNTNAAAPAAAAATPAPPSPADAAAASITKTEPQPGPSSPAAFADTGRQAAVVDRARPQAALSSSMADTAPMAAVPEAVPYAASTPVAAAPAASAAVRGQPDTAVAHLTPPGSPAEPAPAPPAQSPIHPPGPLQSSSPTAAPPLSPAVVMHSVAPVDPPAHPGPVLLPLAPYASAEITQQAERRGGILRARPALFVLGLCAGVVFGVMAGRLLLATQPERPRPASSTTTPHDVGTAKAAPPTKPGAGSATAAPPDKPHNSGAAATAAVAGAEEPSGASHKGGSGISSDPQKAGAETSQRDAAGDNERRLSRRDRRRLSHYLRLARRAFRRHHYRTARMYAMRALRIQPRSPGAKTIKQRAEDRLRR